MLIPCVAAGSIACVMAVYRMPCGQTCTPTVCAEFMEDFPDAAGDEPPRSCVLAT
jgi:hypothetical protein